MKKKVVRLLTLMAMLLPLAACADTVQCLVLTEANGAVSKFALTDAPVVTYNGGDMIVSYSDQELTIALEGLVWTFGEMEATRIDEVIGKQDDAAHPQFSFGEARFEGLQPGGMVQVYSLDGKALSTVKADGDGRVSVCLGNLPRGIYVLRTPTRSFKIKH